LSNISITIIPRDQMSISVLYSCLAITSGAIQYGVPTRDLRLRCWPVTRAQKPKSDSFTWRGLKELDERPCKDLTDHWQDKRRYKEHVVESQKCDGKVFPMIECLQPRFAV
jgi:hypothetical protein